MFRELKFHLVDIDGYNNWGRTIRNGHEVLIVTDYGL